MERTLFMLDWLENLDLHRRCHAGLNLVIAAIVYWNTIYMDAVAQHLRSISVPVPDEILAHTSPVGWEHIAFSGDFLWDRAAAQPKRSLIVLA
nr:Tn3 family transposase [Sphingobium sp. LB126]